MPDWIYAYRRGRDLTGQRTIELFISETGRPAPAGFVSCSATTFRWAWRYDAALTFRRLRGHP